MNVGIIGRGYVGSAVAASYRPDELMINDPAYPDISRPLSELKDKCDVIFICVPTPQSADGACDTSILELVVEQLFGYRGLVISKSTASPSVYTHLEKESGLRFAHVPEFLTQVNAVNDYLEPHKVVIGCSEGLRTDITKVLIDKSSVKFYGKIDYCTVAEASMFKYLANTQLAIKVTVNNEYYDLCQSLGIDWATIADMAKTDPRLGTSHWAVPGPDGSRGYGGACFPKDTAALAKIARDLDIDLAVLNAAIAKNTQYRPDGI